jgi:hypothetical protein
MAAFSKDDGEEDIAQVTAAITEQLMRTTAVLKRKLSARPECGVAGEVQKNVCKGFIEKFKSLQMQFRDVQRVHLATSSGMHSSPTERDEDMGFTYAQHMQVEDAVALSSERDVEIQAICASINALAVLFNDLASLVSDQGTILDRVDHNLAESVTRVSAGVHHLKGAEKAQRRSVSQKCIALLAVLIGIMIVVLVLRSV